MQLRDEQIALDYLSSRPEVDAGRIGASGEGTLRQEGSGAVTTVNLSESVKYYNNSTGTIGTTNAAGTSLIGLTEGLVTRDMTNINLYGDADFQDPNKKAGWTTLDLVQRGLGEIDIGTNLAVARGAVS